MHMAWDAEGQKFLGIIWCMVVLIGFKNIFWGNVNMLIVDLVSVYISIFDKLCEMPGNERHGHINKTIGFCCPQPFKSIVTSSFVW